MIRRPYLPGLSQTGLSTWLRYCLVPHFVPPRISGPGHLWLTIADHFEPVWKHPSDENALGRVQLWRREWPVVAGRCRDSAGLPARYTFFYPAEAYDPRFIGLLAEMTRMGIADVEVHYHHGGESRAEVAAMLGGFVERLESAHGISRRRNGRPAFGFIHGDWALDNSLPGGAHCGLNDELTLLGELGCYADFTMPCGEIAAQARTVNRIYWAIDDPDRPKSSDTGIAVRPGASAVDGLLMIPGPFGARPSEDWEKEAGHRPWGLRHLSLPWMSRLETGEVASYDRVSERRVRGWLDLAPRIGNHVFLKLFTHGAQERHSSVLLGGELEKTYRLVADECRRRGWRYSFASAWEMFQAVEAARHAP